MHPYYSIPETMLLLCFLILTCFNNTIFPQQNYDPSDCSANTSYPGSRYTCNSYLQNSCQTFLVYRANQHFKTISDISRLLRVDPDELLHLNNLTSSLDILQPAGREVLVPVTCSCIGQFFQVNFSYMVPESTTLSEIACAVFEGLLKLPTLAEENKIQENDVGVGAVLQVPLRCACPDHSFSTRSGVEYLVTYPLVEGDEPTILSKKFGISPVDLWVANHFDPWPTIFPNTTVLIPLKTYPVINFNIPNSPPPIAHGFLPTITVEKTTNTKLRNLCIAGSVVGFSLLLAALLLCGFYVKTLHKRKVEKLQSFNSRSCPISCTTARSSPRSGRTGISSATSCLSPDLLVGIKYSLKNYSIEDLRKMTKDFSKETMIGDETYKGSIDNVEMMIKQMRFEDTRQVIHVHSKINHINILNLLGVCYGESDFSWSYLVFELPSNGCLRDWLSNSTTPLRWNRRTQIAFDIATGLHYLHYCIFPSYAHMSVSSRNIFLTANWRAKLTNIRANTSIGISLDENDSIESVKGWLAPEYILNGSASEKVDIFAFGVVLLELVSGRDVVDGKSFKDSIGFLGGGGTGGEGGCFEQLRNFMDPCLKEDYPLAEALCLAVLAKACVEDDPLHRPSMDDILKVLVRMV